MFESDDNAEPIENEDVNTADTGDQPVDENVDVDPQDAGDPEPSDQPQEDDWQPDFTYKVYDEIREIPEDVRDAITSKEREEYFKKLYSKADGLEGVKAKYEKAKDYVKEKDMAYNEVVTELNNYRERNDALKYYAKNDLDAFHKAAEIDDQTLFNHVARKIALMENPDQLDEYNQQSEAKRENYILRKRLEKLESNVTSEKQNADMNELKTALAEPEIESVKTRIDSVLGDGAFITEVADYGRKAAMNKRPCSPRQAIEHVVEKYTKLIPANEQPKPETSTEEKPKNLPQLGKGKKVIPKKMEIRSLEDLKKRAQQLKEQGL